MKKEEALDILDDNHTKLVNYDYSDEELGKAHNTAINSLENQCDFWDLEAGTCRKTEVPVNNSKLVNSDDLIKKLKEHFNFYVEAYDGIKNMPDIEKARIDEISNCIAAIVNEKPIMTIKTGQWKRISPAGIYECSECGQNVMTGDIECYQFCHEKKKKMEGVKL